MAAMVIKVTGTTVTCLSVLRAPVCTRSEAAQVSSYANLSFWQGKMDLCVFEAAAWMHVTC